MRKQTEVQVLHDKVEFFCDECGEYLASSIEYDDGYIPIPVEVKCLHEKLYCDGTWYEFDGGDLCYRCYSNKRKALHDGLLKIGFTNK